MKAKELVGKVAVRTQPALFKRDERGGSLNPEILKIDERFWGEPIKILKVTEHNILIKFVSPDGVVTSPFPSQTKKIVLPEYFLDGNWESAEPFKRQFESEESSVLFRDFEASDINVQQEMAKMAEEMNKDNPGSQPPTLVEKVRREINSEFANVVSGFEVNTDKVKKFIDLIFPEGEIDLEDKDDSEIIMESISKIKDLEPEKSKEVLNIIIGVAEDMAVDMVKQQELNDEKTE